ncbi:MAG: M12 family metallo-peptidase, partial [Pyrinomonadaceae bacterium]
MRRLFTHTKAAVCLLVSGAGLICPHIIPLLRQSSAMTAASRPTPGIKRDLDRFFKAHELIKVDPRQAAEQVNGSGHLTLVTPQGTLDLVLTPHDMRAPEYRAVKVGADGAARLLDIDAARTFKGAVAGAADSHARLTIDERGVEGLIFRDGERYHVEPARKFSASTASADHVLYKASDVVQNSPVACAVTAGAKANAAGNHFAPAPDASASPARVVDLATEADYEYVSAHGGPANALREILSILNQVEGIYEAELGITFRVVFQHAWETAADPYTTTADSLLIINEFREHWNANFTHVARDAAHMWTGKYMGGVLGRGWQGVACQTPALSYGISRNDDRAPLKYNTPAHEIGHNLGASHADAAPECVGSIMRPTTSGGLSFCQFSRAEIAQYVGGFGHCLTADALHSVGGLVADVNGNPAGGVRLELGGGRTAGAQTDPDGKYGFDDLAAGGNYAVTPSKAGYTFTPQSLSFNNLSNDQT